jgi:hyaluronoglucosaminidase
VGQWWGWGRLLPVNAVTGIRGPDIAGARFITAAALSPDGTTVWAVGRDSRTVLPVSLTTGKPGTPVPVGINPIAVVVVRHSS